MKKVVMLQQKEPEIHPRLCPVCRSLVENEEGIVCIIQYIQAIREMDRTVQKYELSK